MCSGPRVGSATRRALGHGTDERAEGRRNAKTTACGGERGCGASNRHEGTAAGPRGEGSGARGLDQRKANQRKANRRKANQRKANQRKANRRKARSTSTFVTAPRSEPRASSHRSALAGPRDAHAHIARRASLTLSRPARDLAAARRLMSLRHCVPSGGFKVAAQRRAGPRDARADREACLAHAQPARLGALAVARRLVSYGYCRQLSAVPKPENDFRLFLLVTPTRIELVLSA